MLEALREVADRQAVRREQLLGVGRLQAGLQGCRHRLGVDRDEPHQAAQVERHHSDEAPAQRRHPAHHARAAAERHGGDPVRSARAQHGDDLVVVSRQQHRVRRGFEYASTQSQQVGGALAGGVPQSAGAIGAHVVGADDDSQRIKRSLFEPCVRQLDVRLGDRRRVAMRNLQALLQQRPHLVVEGHAALG